MAANVIASAGSSATANGTIAAKMSGETDESGPSTRTARRPEERVADEAEDGRVQAGHGRNAGQLGVGHALRDEDRSEDDPGHEVVPEPATPVRAPHAATPGAMRPTTSERGRSTVSTPAS